MMISQVYAHKPLRWYSGCHVPRNHSQLREKKNYTKLYHLKTITQSLNIISDCFLNRKQPTPHNSQVQVEMGRETGTSSNWQGKEIARKFKSLSQILTQYSMI